MRAEIITIGNELLSGNVLNTNTYYLTKRLSEIGIEVLYHTSVKDDAQMLKDVVNIGLNRADLLIFTGGLGPTYDDLSKEVICNSLGLNLTLNEECKKTIEDYFRKLNREM